MCWHDSTGKKICFEGEEKNDRWFREKTLTIRGDSIFIYDAPVFFRRNKKFYSESDGGFYYYSGTINYREKKIWIATIKLDKCDYCIRKLDTASRQTGDEKIVLKILPKEKNLLVNGLVYKPIR